MFLFAWVLIVFDVLDGLECYRQGALGVEPRVAMPAYRLYKSIVAGASGRVGEAR